MRSSVLRALWGVKAVAPVRPDRTERRLRRFNPRLQGAVRALARRHPRLADLAVSFPALLFALAAPRCGFAPEPVIIRVIEGARLAELAAAAGLPLWTRKLAPEAFDRSLPRLSGGDLIRRRIANHLPQSPKVAAKWLRAVAEAAEWGDDAFAVWVAREIIHDEKQVDLSELRQMALWAWFSTRPGCRAHDLAERRWEPSMRFKAAVSAADAWRFQAELLLYLRDEPIADMWVEAGSAGGYDFAPLRTMADVVEEATAMENCLRQYGSSLGFNRARLWGVRKDGARVATLRLGVRYPDPLPNICELKMPKNESAPAELWQAARNWLQASDLLRANAISRRRSETVFDRAQWAGLWRPYWLARRRIPSWLPLVHCGERLWDMWRL
jgi:hypothetical protein